MLYDLKLLKFVSITDMIAIVFNMFSQCLTYALPFRQSLRVTESAETETVEDADADDQSGDNLSTNGSNNETPSFSTTSKCTMTGDNEDKDDGESTNHCCDGCKHNIPIVTNYYCYDQRVYNIYKVRDDEEQLRSPGLTINTIVALICESLKLVNWKYALTGCALLIAVAALLCYLSFNTLSWLIFHKLFGLLYDNGLLVATDRDNRMTFW